VATVFGGSGFIGRYVVKRLAQQGFVVRVPSRDPEGALFLKPMGAVGQVVPLYASVTHEATVTRAVEAAEIVVNLVGQLAESGSSSFQAIHVEGAERIARQSAAAGVGRLMQVSAIGADPASPSRYASTKGKAEQAVLAAFPAATILRPSVVFGPEDNFFNRFAAIARLSPIMPVIAGGTKMQPVFVGDVADAVMAALTRHDAPGRIYQLGGPRIYTFRELMELMLRDLRRRRALVSIPFGLARFQAFFLEHLPGRPLLTRDQVRLLEHDSIVQHGAATLADLGITPTAVELVLPTYLEAYRRGGRYAATRTVLAGPGES
jgi:NADH dehydrogenase